METCPFAVLYSYLKIAKLGIIWKAQTKVQEKYRPKLPMRIWELPQFTRADKEFNI